MPRLRFSSSTMKDEEIVPWLASTGELAYSPHSPPDRDYYFQYSWVIPGIFQGDPRVRRHFWFGCPLKDDRDVKLLFVFWNRARRGELDTLYMSNGRSGLEDVTAPLAVYGHSDVNPCARERVIFMQHGSYLIADMESQPPHRSRRGRSLQRSSEGGGVFAPQVDHCGCPPAVDEGSRPNPGGFGHVIQRHALQCVAHRNGMVQ